MSVLLPLDLICNMLLGDILKYRQPKRTEFFGCDCAAVMYFLILIALLTWRESNPCHIYRRNLLFSRHIRWKLTDDKLFCRVYVFGRVLIEQLTRAKMTSYHLSFS